MINGITLEFNLHAPADLLQELVQKDDGSENYEERVHAQLIALVEADPMGALEKYSDGSCNVEVW